MDRVRRRIPLWLYALAAALIVVLYLAASIQRGLPIGDDSDIAALARRDDVNLLFIVVDTLRADRLGRYGYERDTSPHLDALAASGVRFANHMSQSSWTKASMASLWTGLYPSHTGVIRYPDAVSDQARMPAEILREAGFRTAATWRNGWIAPNFGFAQGFESYHNPMPRPLPAGARAENPSLVGGGSDADLIDSALGFLRSHQDERWFLYVHMMDVHQYVYDSASALFGTRYSDAYDNAIRRVDGLIGILLEGLVRTRQRDRTVVAVVADHGEAFGEHGFEGHAKNLYGEVTRTPFLIAFPFRLSAGRVVEYASQNVDVWPTLLALLGLPPLPDADGRSLLPLMLGAAKPADSERIRFAHLDRTWGRTREKPLPIVSVTDTRHRLVYHVDHPEELELYDLVEDPHEQRNLAAEHPELAARLREHALQYVEGIGAPWGSAPTIEIDAMHLQQLRALGYKLD